MRRAAHYLSVGGVALAVVVLSAYHARRIAVPAYSVTGTSRFTWMIGYIFLISLATYAVGLPDQPRNKRQAAWLALLATAFGALGISMVQLLTGDALLPRFVVFGAALLNVPIQVAINTLSRQGYSRDEGRDRVLLVASDAERERLVDDLRLEPEHGASLVGWLTTDDVVSRLPDREAIIEMQRASRATLVVLDHEAQAKEAVISQIAQLHESGVRVRTLVAFYEHWLGKLPLDELERTSLFFDIGEVHGSRYGRIKRITDIGFAVFGLMVLAIATPFVALGNLIANRGSLLYRQSRVGKGGESFTILKFRTMVQGNPRNVRQSEALATSYGEWTSENDPRITPFGRLLRRSHLDELPQMINILMGDLSIVGPRPEQPHYVKELSEKLAFYNLRHLVQPGLTGWAQVKYGYAGDESDALEKLQYEFFYLQKQNLTFDLRIIVRTLRSTVGGRGIGR
ncbi:MAG: sugar transferase [Microthrixaceae bacterium]|nr:sugar transferase [Microthrixaceae bacterium]